MDLDITTHKGHKNKPVIIFIHGLAMDKNIWIEPLETRAFAKNVPLRFMAARKPRPARTIRIKLTFGKIPDRVNTIWETLAGQHFNLVSWSQHRPAGPIINAVKDLERVVIYTRRKFSGRPIVLICHSRGGLIARKYLERRRPFVRALITIASPHAGSSLSRIGKYITPLAPVIGKFMSKESRGAIARILKSIKELVDGNALKELMPDSDFIRGLKDSPSDNIRYLSFGGRKTEVVNLYRWVRHEGVYVPEKILSLPDSLLKHIPGKAIPDELKPGRGDIMVTAKSAKLPWAERHINVNANHFTILWNRKVITHINHLVSEL